MKKISLMGSLILVVVMVLTLTACSNAASPEKGLIHEGVAPYALSDEQKSVLECLNMEDAVHMIEYHGPEEALSLHVNVYRLEGGEWKSLGGGSLSAASGEERESFEGVLALRLKENYAIDFIITPLSGGRSSYKTEQIFLESDMIASSVGFLDESQDIQLNEEIPVAIMAYDSKTGMKDHTLRDFFNPSALEGLDLVQAVTLMFSDQGV